MWVSRCACVRLLLCVRVLLLLWFKIGGLIQEDCCEYGMCRMGCAACVCIMVFGLNSLFPRDVGEHKSCERVFMRIDSSW